MEYMFHDWQKFAAVRFTYAMSNGIRRFGVYEPNDNDKSNI